MLISKHESSQKRANMIQEMHFRNLSQKVINNTYIFNLNMLWVVAIIIIVSNFKFIIGLIIKTYRRSCSTIGINEIT